MVLTLCAPSNNSRTISFCANIVFVSKVLFVRKIPKIKYPYPKHLLVLVLVLSSETFDLHNS